MTTLSRSFDLVVVWGIISRRRSVHIRQCCGKTLLIFRRSHRMSSEKVLPNVRERMKRRGDAVNAQAHQTQSIMLSGYVVLSRGLSKAIVLCAMSEKVEKSKGAENAM